MIQRRAIVKKIVAGCLTAGAMMLAEGVPTAIAQTTAPARNTQSSPAAGAPQTPIQELLGNFAPKMVDLTDNVLFGDVWERPQLSKRDRSLVTVSALVAMTRPDQLRSHLIRARDNGLAQEELTEAITHLAFYAGWPSALTVMSMAKDVFEKK
jgi:4-carboxymuconolactone decarboxylase